MTVCFLLSFVFVPYLFPLKAIHLFNCLLTLRDRYLCHQLLCLFALDFFYSFVLVLFASLELTDFLLYQNCSHGL